jgi:hypothetical protein
MEDEAMYLFPDSTQREIPQETIAETVKRLHLINEVPPTEELLRLEEEIQKKKKK